MRVSEIIRSQDQTSNIVRVRHERSARRKSDVVSRLDQAVADFRAVFGKEPQMQQTVFALTRIVGQLKGRYRDYL